MARRPRLDRAACERQAAAVLKKTGVESWPVRVDKVAKSLAVKVRYSPLDEDLSGMIFYKDDVAIIGVNSRHHVNRQRFTIAHELGHFRMHNDVLRHGAHVDKFITMLNRDSNSAKGVVSIEVEANQFAAALLMPKSLIVSYMDEKGLSYGTVPDEDAIDEMARAFKVSETAMAIRVGTIF